MDLNSTLSDMWRTRPPRLPQSQGGNAMVAGVCEGIGARYRLDPTLVRLAFVALSLSFGGGIFLYLLLWMIMPRFGMTTSPWTGISTPKEKLSAEERRDRDTGWWLLVGLFVFFPSLTFGAGGAGALSSLVTLAVAALALYLLHTRQPLPPEGLLAAPEDTAPPVDTSHLTTPVGYPHPGAGRTTPPSWDPLGTAPELWDLPEPPPAEPEPAPKRNRLVPWILVAGGAAVLVTALGAAGLVIRDSDVAGSKAYTVTDNLRESYETGVGSVSLDLAGLEPLDDDRTVTVTHGIGEVTIVPPADVRTELTCHTGVGETECPAVLNNDTSGATLHLEAEVGIGSIRVAG
ncbi:PspC domain-containing protein [Corynebacterium capitovis]|uniref:PspC domain-containing protein n=1 Tax=Corynebacterium capitovis TaxID=131081 RepID=UPI0003A8F2D0|nr:PspC domain-containing protein [Corynebacterium capitovis]